jgi:preprotein translocase SecE subunit
MGRIRNTITGFKTFFGEVQVELQKCAWPTKPELVESTVMVIVASILLGAFVGFGDFGLVKFLGAVIQ